jgi:hypothetical protein
MSTDLHEFLQSVDDEREKFHTSLGRLMLSWNHAEAELFGALRRYAGVSPKVARAIFSGTRARQMIDFIRNIHHNTDAADAVSDDFQDISIHLNAINDVRDKVVHHTLAGVWSWGEEGVAARHISNLARASRAGNEFTIVVDSKIMDEMSQDLMLAAARLKAHADKKNEPFVPYVIDGKRPSWLYRPLQQRSPKSKNSSTPQAPASPQKSLRVKRRCDG